MGERTRSVGADQVPPARLAAPPAVTRSPVVARAIALQRSMGNRAAGRVLSRWAAHPDKDKKGVLMTDAGAGQWNRFNPPLSK